MRATSGPTTPSSTRRTSSRSKFGSATGVAIGLIVKEGTIFTPETLAKIDRITKSIDGVEAGEQLPAYDSHTEERDELRTKIEEQAEAAGEELTAFQIIKRLDRVYPPYPVNHDQVRSVVHRSTRVFEIQPDGAIENRLLVKKIPKTQEEADALREIVRQNPPVIFGRFVSYDEKAALITADFVTDRISGSHVFSAIFDHVQRIKEVEQDDKHEIVVSGVPVLVGWILKHAFEIGAYVAATVFAIFLLLWLYFRRWHGVVIPFIAAIATVIWGLGYCGWRGINFDPLILVIPMIITARAVSAHRADGRTLLRGLRDHAADVRRPGRSETPGRRDRDERADRARYARHLRGRRRFARDPGDHRARRCATWASSVRSG